MEIGIYEDKELWNMFNSKYPRFLEIIPEDSDISESIFYTGKSQIMNNSNINNKSKINGNNIKNNMYKSSINHINNRNNNINNNINDKESDEFKKTLKKAFEKINEDFLIMNPIFIPLMPGNDPNDLFNEEKQI